ncbi:MAG: peptidoglycan DD-metalloendopeptidase family protein [Clostridiales bacterium]|nr:peptidoglycan DD-metalloendopeptidase family protein [Clostridiales bacterium]
MKKKSLIVWGLTAAMLCWPVSYAHAAEYEKVQQMPSQPAADITEASENNDSTENDADTENNDSADSADSDHESDNTVPIPEPVYTEGWITTANGNRWQKKDGSIACNAWVTSNGKKYYLGHDGAVQTGWLQLDSKWYYLNADGTAAENCWIDTYYIDSNGIWDTSKTWHQPGWQKNRTGWWWQDEDGSYPAAQWKLIHHTWYYFFPSGYMATGWQYINGSWYYLAPSGAMATGWQYINGTWYYLNPSGAMTTGWQYINGTWYYLNSSGAMTTGWQYINDKWYYLTSSGAMATGWQYINGSWYYLNPSGAMTTGWQYINNKWYYLDASGAMTTGWRLINGIWYYLNGSGDMATGWLSLKNIYYYLEDSGAMAQNIWKEMDGKWYYFTSSGAMARNTWIGECYVDNTGAWIENPDTDNLFIWPCPGYTTVTSDYGYRGQPASGASTYHKGIDIGAPHGAAIVASSHGTVQAYGYNSSMGNYVKLKHANGTVSVSMHMSSIATTISTGKSISAGSVIGYVGSTGVSTGAHLHFSIMVGNSYVSPWDYLSRPNI